MFKSSTSTYDLQTILVQDFVPIRTALRGGGVASSSFILFFYLLYWYYSYIVYFVCAPASEFGTMGTASFLRFSYPNTRYYGDKILYKNLDLTQDFPNKILFHSLWEQNLVQNLPQDLQIAGNVLIWQNLSLRFSNGGYHENLDAARKSIAPLLSLGDKR